MAQKKRVRETLIHPPGAEYLNSRLQAGWKLIAIEWERDTGPGDASPEPWTEEIPYGLQVSSDCSRLEENQEEVAIIVMALDRIVEDSPLSRVAEELNRRGYRTRSGELWTAPAVFNLLPRMIDVGPRVFASEEWATRRRRLPRVG